MKVKTLLRSSKRWTKGVLAKTPRGHVVPPRDPRASRYCLVGAIRKCYRPSELMPYELETKAQNKVMKVLRKLYPEFLSVSSFNDDDDTTFADIKRVIARANI